MNINEVQTSQNIKRQYLQLDECLLTIATHGNIKISEENDPFQCNTLFKNIQI